VGQRLSLSDAPATRMERVGPSQHRVRMRILRDSSTEEYARWYLRRNQLKHQSEIVDGGSDAVEVMWQRHAGKMRHWFRMSPLWQIVSLDSRTDLENLVFLESDWTKQEGLVVPNGKDYYDKLVAGSFRIDGENRVAICSAEAGEIRSNPSANYYLLDGVGRCLPYLILLERHELEWAPIEAFCAVRKGNAHDR